jgi:hypothetical protein
MKKIISVLCLSFLCSMNSYAQINLDGSQAVSLWNRIDNIGRNEKVEIIHEENGQKVIHLEKISCVFEMYNGCSLFVISPTERKMIVALDGSADFMNQLAYAGVFVDEENARMYVKAIDCTNDGTDTLCKIEEDEN